MLSSRPTGQQTMTQNEVDLFLTDARTAPKTKSPRILGINQIQTMKSLNNGYPKDMYHPQHEMRQAFKEEEESALASIGYGLNYIFKHYPKTLFRRNMAANFEPRFDPSTGLQLNQAFVEERVARTEQEEITYRAMKVKNGVSGWFDKVTDLPEIAEDEAANTPEMKIARLEGRLEAQASQSLPGMPGRPRRH